MKFGQSLPQASCSSLSSLSHLTDADSEFDLDLGDNFVDPVLYQQQLHASMRHAMALMGVVLGESAKVRLLYRMVQMRAAKLRQRKQQQAHTDTTCTRCKGPNMDGDTSLFPPNPYYLSCILGQSSSTLTPEDNVTSSTLAQDEWNDGHIPDSVFMTSLEYYRKAKAQELRS